MPHDPHHVAALIIGKMHDNGTYTKPDDDVHDGDEELEMVEQMFASMHQDHATDDDKEQFLDALKAFVHDCWQKLEGEEDIEGKAGEKYDQGAGGSYDE